MQKLLLTRCFKKEGNQRLCSSRWPVKLEITDFYVIFLFTPHRNTFMGTYLSNQRNLSWNFISLLVKCYKSYKGEERAASLPEILHIRPEGCGGIFWIHFFSVIIVSYLQVVWNMGMLIKSYPPEASTIKNIEDSWALLKTEDGQKRWIPCEYNKVFVSQTSTKVWRLPSRVDERHRRPSQWERAAPSWDRWLRPPGVLSLLQQS